MPVSRKYYDEKNRSHSSRLRSAHRVKPSHEVGTAAPCRAGSRADIEARLPPPHGPALLDVSLTHPRTATYVADAAAMQGPAALARRLAQPRYTDS